MTILVTGSTGVIGYKSWPISPRKGRGSRPDVLARKGKISRAAYPREGRPNG